ncbi:MAG: alpha/beta hydrolase [Steroidobacteraceae bacterium]|jgi:pimeloyl-ACP methyl ester carboxylesterase|nr:alpha/beta hydrolase [Steroidobacteraceae bacterium]
MTLEETLRSWVAGGPPDADALSRRALMGALAALGTGLVSALPVALSADGASQAPAAPGGEAAAPLPAVEASAGEVDLAPLDRAFLRLREGLLHYRSAGFTVGTRARRGAPLPLYMVHAGPGSSRGLEGLVRRLGTDRAVIAPDTLGAGDSAAPDVPVPEVAYYAESVVRTLDALGLARVDYYGSHTGAHIGCELALRWPDRVRRMVFDGVPVFPAALRAELLEHYAPPVQPDDAGRQLAWAWQFVRDMSQFFPHYARDAGHRLANAVPSADALHRSVVEVLKALPTYHLAYQATFRHDIERRLPLLRLPVLCIGREGDPLASYVERAVALVPGAVPLAVARADGAAGLAGAIRRFLA